VKESINNKRTYPDVTRLDGTRRRNVTHLYSLAKPHLISQNTIQLVVVQRKHPLKTHLSNLTNQTVRFSVKGCNYIEYEESNVKSYQLVVP
jgi:Leucine-rich repeat (LRR) protein